jgi:two-component sensor histidine kinase/nucleotide-binding universal stress UspA family protein
MNHVFHSADIAPATPNGSSERRTAASCKCALTEHRCTEACLRKELARANAELRRKEELIRNQELLRKESDHRLLNDLQMIVSLLLLQSRASANAEVASQLAAASDRIATIGRMHRHLHYCDGVQTVEFKQFLNDLCRDFSTMLSSEQRPERVIDVEGIQTELPSVTAIPLGFIVNELITNAAKYGKGRIAVRFERNDGKGYALSVSDDGPGCVARKFDESASLAAVSAEARVLSATAAGSGDVFGQLARKYDLSIVGQVEPHGGFPEDLIVEGALFTSGRPVLIVPYIQVEPFALNRVLLCWDGSRSAARAVADALPLIERAKNVEVITIATREDNRDEISGADIAHHLARHRVKVELKRIVAPDTDVPNTILSYVADTATDIIVMGGYGHSRLREFILSGATRGMLASMTVPTLMSH